MRAFVILLAVVLVAIGIGIGAEAAAAPASYGTAPGRFYATFPGTPKLATSRSTTAGVRREWTYTGTGATSQLVVDGILLRQAADGENFAVLVFVRGSRFPTIRARPSPPEETGAGGLPASLVVSCLPQAPARHDRCVGSLSVSPTSRRVEWTVAASGPSAQRVEQLLASFAPAGE